MNVRTLVWGAGLGLAAIAAADTGFGSAYIGAFMNRSSLEIG